MRDSDVIILKERLEYLVKMVDDLHHTVCGNGQPGLKIRVDRLEQSRKSRDKVLWFLSAGFVGLFGQVASNWLSK